MQEPHFSPYQASIPGELDETHLTPTQLEDIYQQHEDAAMTCDSLKEVDPRTETGEAPRSPKTGDKPLPTQAKPVEEVDPNGKNEGC